MSRAVNALLLINLNIWAGSRAMSYLLDTPEKKTPRSLVTKFCRYYYETLTNCSNVLRIRKRRRVRI